jgi:hypothetical protein
MSHSETLGELAKALAAFQGKMEPVAKTAENPFFKSKYADLASVVKAAAPVLSACGLSVAQFPDDGTLVTYLLHESGEWIEHAAPLNPAKSDPQGVGSAITYFRRYAYCAALGIVADEDDDGQAASQPAAKPRTVRQPPTATQADENGEVTTGRNGKVVTPKQLDFIHKLAEERGLRGADLKDYTQMVLERDVAKMAEITAAEASALIDALKNVPVEEEPAG